jgi:hypothetical protein
MMLITWQVIVFIISLWHHQIVPIEGKNDAEVNQCFDNTLIEVRQTFVSATDSYRYDRSLVLVTARANGITLSNVISATSICQQYCDGSDDRSADFCNDFR